MFSKRYVNTTYIRHEFRRATFVNYDTTRQTVDTKHKPCVRAGTSHRAAVDVTPRRGKAYYNAIELMQLSFPTPAGRCHHNRFWFLVLGYTRTTVTHVNTIKLFHGQTKTNSSWPNCIETLSIYFCFILRRVQQLRLYGVI